MRRCQHAAQPQNAPGSVGHTWGKVLHKLLAVIIVQRNVGVLKISCQGKYGTGYVSASLPVVGTIVESIDNPDQRNIHKESRMFHAEGGGLLI